MVQTLGTIQQLRIYKGLAHVLFIASTGDIFYRYPVNSDNVDIETDDIGNRWKRYSTGIIKLTVEQLRAIPVPAANAVYFVIDATPAGFFTLQVGDFTTLPGNDVIVSDFQDPDFFRFFRLDIGGSGGGTGDVNLTGEQTVEDKTLVNTTVKTGTTSADDQPGDIYQRSETGPLEPIHAGDDYDVLTSLDGKWLPLPGGGLQYSPGPGIAISPERVVSAIGTPGTNPMGYISLYDHGGVSGAGIAGTSFTGTDNYSAAVAAIAACPDGGTIIASFGRYFVGNPLTVPQNKRINFIWDGDVYAPNGLFYIGPGTRRHRLIVTGELLGRAGMLDHSLEAYNASTGMNSPTGANWDSLTASAFKLEDCFRTYIAVGMCEGYKAAWHFYGGTSGNGGGQENTFAFKYLVRNNYGIWLQSADGSSYIDKNLFCGLDGEGRIGGNQSVFIDGHASEKGAALSNKFENILFERANSYIKIRGYAQTTKFDGCTLEGGDSTGCFSKNYIDISSTAVAGGQIPRGTSFVQCGVFYLDWLSKIGWDTTITATQLWNRNAEVPVGSNALGGIPGRITVQGALTLSEFSRSNFPPNIDYYGLSHATGDPSTIVLITRINGVDRTASFVGGTGGGGTNQWSTQGSNLFTTHKVGLGGVPDVAAFLSIAAGSTTVAQALLADSPIPTVIRNGNLGRNGSDIIFGRNNAPAKVMFQPAGGGSLQMLRSNFQGTDTEWIRQPLAKGFATTAEIDYGYSTFSSIIGGVKALEGVIQLGDWIEAEGCGVVQSIPGSAGSFAFGFYAGGNVNGQADPGFTITGSAGTLMGSYYKYRYRIQPLATGSSVACVMDMEIHVNNPTTGQYLPFFKIAHPASGFNTLAPILDVVFKFMTFDSHFNKRIYSNFNTAKIIRSPYGSIT